MGRRLFVLPTSEPVTIDILPTDTVYDLKRRLFQNTGGWYNILLDSTAPLGTDASTGLYDKVSDYFSINEPPPDSDEESAIFLIQAMGPGGAEPHRRVYSQQHSEPPLSTRRKRRSRRKSVLTGFREPSPLERLENIWELRKEGDDENRSWGQLLSGRKSKDKNSPTKQEIYDAAWAIVEDAAVKAEEKGDEKELEAYQELQNALAQADDPEALILQEEIARKQRSRDHLSKVGREVTSTLHSVTGPNLFGAEAIEVPGTDNRPVKDIAWEKGHISAKNLRFNYLSSLIPQSAKAISNKDTFRYSDHINRIRHSLRHKPNTAPNTKKK